MNTYSVAITKINNHFKKSKFLICLFVIVCFPSKVFSQSDSLDVYDLDLAQLSKVKITSATKVAQNITELPSSIIIITKEEIKENGYFTLEEALSTLPGFQFRNIQGFNSYVFQRGIPNQNNLSLVLIDGVQVNELNSGGFYAGGQYNLSNLERIEVIYGPASVAYGTNALSGIINLVTKSALKEQFKVNSRLGSFNTYSGDINYCYTNEEKSFGVLFSGMYKTTTKADLKGIAGDNNWTDKMDNFENDYSFDLKIQNGDFLFGANYLYKKASRATSTKSIGTVFRDFGTSWNVQFLNTYLKFEKKFSNKFSLSSILYNRNATVLNNTIYFVVDTAQIGYYRPNNLTGFENVLNYNMNDMISIAGGLTFEYERLSKKNTTSYSDSPYQKPPTPEKTEMLNNYLASIFIEPHIKLQKKLHLSGGARLDYSSIYDLVLTPRMGVSYYKGNYILHLSYSEAFRAPKPWDYTDGLGNESLIPEKMKSLEASVTLSIPDLFQVDLTGYLNNLKNAFVKETILNGYRWVNSGEVNTEGVEISVKHKSKNWKSSLNYTFNQSYDEFHQFVSEISKHSVNAGMTYYLSKNLSVNLRTNYIGKRKNPKLIAATNSNFIDPCLVFHGAISLLDYEGFDIQLSAKNIFDVEYYHTSNREPDRYRQSQRTILLSVGYAFTY
ncbi:MAG: TonB-dependent receptor plug domain-containing protein [Bacteroidetes bacterium]|nr:TonB-dependent receptor plug domain-containing protein [Bacteroidota bacterium]